LQCALDQVEQDARASLFLIPLLREPAATREGIRKLLEDRVKERATRIALADAEPIRRRSVGRVVDKCNEYREFAAECVRRAMRASGHANKALLLEMAQRRVRLAVLRQPKDAESALDEVPRQQPSVPPESLN
jgi:hypothetical protein